MGDLSIWDLLNHGGYAMWVVLAFSIIAVAVGIERAVAQWKFLTHARALSETVSRCLAKGALDEARSACERSPSPLADVYLVGYEKLGRTSTENLGSAVHRERVRVMVDLKNRLWVLGTIGATAPFVGLFGTVVGIMMAMQDIKKAGKSGLDVVAGPISEALIMTAAGILVAVEAVMIYNYFNQRLQRIALEMKMLTDEFLEMLVENAPKGARDAKEAAKDKDGKGGDREAA
jgi:biopolymer transport protein ExbB/TolQ